MNTLKRCLAYLKQHGIRFAHSVHTPAYTARDVASAECMPAHGLAKVVVYSCDNGYGMLMLPADSVVDFGEVCSILGLPNIRLATESELIRLFPDCQVGAMPPFGELFYMPVLMDEEITNSEFIAFSAGTHQDVIHMSVADFRRLVNPLIASFALNTSTVLS